MLKKVTAFNMYRYPLNHSTSNKPSVSTGSTLNVILDYKVVLLGFLAVCRESIQRGKYDFNGHYFLFAF